MRLAAGPGGCRRGSLDGAAGTRRAEKGGRAQGTACAKAWRYETSRVSGIPGGRQGMGVMRPERIRGALTVGLELDPSPGAMRSCGLLSRCELGLLLLVGLLSRLDVWTQLSLGWRVGDARACPLTSCLASDIWFLLALTAHFWSQAHSPINVCGPDAPTCPSFFFFFFPAFLF